MSRRLATHIGRVAIITAIAGNLVAGSALVRELSADEFEAVCMRDTCACLGSGGGGQCVSSGVGNPCERQSECKS
jgi:uncharacterized membrane protein